MVKYDLFMVTLSTALGASLLVERILEFLKNIFEPAIGTKYRRMVPGFQEIDQKINDLEKLSKAGEQDGEWDERYPKNTVLVEPATDPDDGTLVRAFILQLMGFALGILAAHYFGLRLFQALAGDSRSIAYWADYLLTGLLIGGGSGPVHVLIRLVTQSKVWIPSGNGVNASEETEDQENPSPGESSPPPAPGLVIKRTEVTSSTPSGKIVDELGIPYYGGVDREKLEWIHVRKENPNLIVYHHTAMEHSSTFEDVVRVIKSRTDSKGNHWVTGYNCVIMADGAIKPFCRWDRYGNHAEGYNMNSLGIAFNGNFETDPQVPFSNTDGRYGSHRPTEAQLKAGARVVGLWTFLYNIRLDFEKTIIAHKQISAKACPGSSFPYDEFKRWIEYYRKQWATSPEMMKGIEAFKLKPYLYVDK
jgi:hypothetical protein